MELWGEDDVDIDDDSSEEIVLTSEQEQIDKFFGRENKNQNYPQTPEKSSGTIDINNNNISDYMTCHRKSKLRKLLACNTRVSHNIPKILC